MTIVLNVPNISCGHCVRTIENELAPLDGVTAVKAEAESKQVTVDVADQAAADQVKATLVDIGYPPAS